MNLWWKCFKSTPSAAGWTCVFLFVFRECFAASLCQTCVSDLPLTVPSLETRHACFCVTENRWLRVPPERCMKWQIDSRIPDIWANYHCPTDKETSVNKKQFQSSWWLPVHLTECSSCAGMGTARSSSVFVLTHSDASFSQEPSQNVLCLINVDCFAAQRE